MTLKNAILIYTAIQLSASDQQALLSVFNNPQRPINTENPVSFAFADAGVVGVGNILPVHRESLRTGAGGIEVDESFVVLADEGVAPSSHPKTVLLVKILDEGSLQGSESGYQKIRVLASNVAEVFETISSGRHGWEDYWRVAQVNGGHFPGE
ncbi:hypothetical protein C0989_001766 [Termitomyces sp. Mn162]|nr:hypothetical protein C0989_001766 [Termitomyces sp. Mn162]KAH0579605.1 hypothetical protein H2248_002457 [Termitomyces sp. 'cryptogamus']